MKPIFIMSILCLTTGLAGAQEARPPATSLSASALADTYARTPSLNQIPPTTLLRPVGANEVQINRYTTQSTLADEKAANPLAVVVTVHFPRGVVETVGDAIRYLLVRTGYEMASLDGADERVKRVLGLKLPQSQRQLGSYRVDTMLSVLMGAPFDLHVDDSMRTVTYTIRDSEQRATSSQAATGDVVGASDEVAAQLENSASQAGPASPAPR